MSGRLTRFIARRYLFSRKSHSVINVISVVSAFTVAVPTAAMIILLSVYNGLDGLLKSLYKNFDPQIKVSLNEGKFFSLDSIDVQQLRRLDGVEFVSGILEENALMSYRGRQHIGTVRGVDSAYVRMIPLDSMMAGGRSRLTLGDLNFAVVGMGVAYNLGVNVNLFDPIEMFTPKSKGNNIFIPTSFYQEKKIMPGGIFALDAETDAQYVLVPLRFAQELFGQAGKVSALGISVKEGADEKEVQEAIGQFVGKQYKVQNRYQQKESLYRIMKYEKAGIFFIILLVLVIASFTLVGALIMLVADKQKETFTLSVMGAEQSFIRKVFVTQGLYISAAGTAAGTVIGLGLSLLQQYAGLVKINSNTLLIDTYPVIVKPFDVVLVILSVMAVNYLISYLTVKAAAK